MNPLAPLLAGPRPLRLDRIQLPPRLSVAVLGPHPDDFDVVAATLRRFQAAGARIALAVLSTGVSGVEDAYCAPDRKADARRAEQRASCRLFGLPDADLEFLPLAEDAEGEPADLPGNTALVANFLDRRRPHAVFLPHGHDQKGGHRNVYALFRPLRGTAIAFLNRDPKTVAFRCDALTAYGPDVAEWKAALLRCHDSQQQRNLRTRNSGFDERILDMDRRSAAEHALAEPFAEAFEVET